MHTTFEIQTSGADLYEFTHAPARWINGQGNGFTDLVGATHLGLFAGTEKLRSKSAN